jgi:hypothetical protein
MPRGVYERRPGSYPFIPLETRFWKHVHKGYGKACWIWVGSAHGRGYGSILVEGKYELAHRVSWRLSKGPIPDGLWVLHKCDVRRCVRPDHLFLGDAVANNADMWSKGRGPRLDGEQNPRAKLCLRDVRTIRKAYARGITRQQLAKKYKLDWSTIDDLVKGKTWKNVSP